MRLFIDDIRKCPEGWILARDYWEAIQLLKDNWEDITEISLDHDISSFCVNKEYTGMDIVCWIEEFCFKNEITPGFTALIHSQNPVGAQRMFDALSKLTRTSFYQWKYDWKEDLVEQVEQEE